MSEKYFTPEIEEAISSVIRAGGWLRSKAKSGGYHPPLLFRTPKEKLIKISSKVVNHSKCVIFQVAKAALPRVLVLEILDITSRLAHEFGRQCSKNRIYL